MTGARRRPRILLLALLGWSTLVGVSAGGEAEEIAELRAIEARLPRLGWPQAARELKAFDLANPAPGPESRDERRRVGDVVAAARAPYLRAFVGRRLEPVVRDLIRRRVEARDSTHAREIAWLKTSAKTDVLAALRREVRDKDPAATDGEIARFWDERPQRQGEFRSVRWPYDRSGEDGKTWRATPIDGRVAYLFGRFLLGKEFFEIASRPEDLPCERCDGTGVLRLTLSNGGTITVVCPACGGRGHPTQLRYR